MTTVAMAQADFPSRLTPAFKRTYGEYINLERGYEVSAPWQTGLTQAGTIGSFFGILLCGTLVERFGYKKTTLIGLVLMIAAVFLTFFAPSPAVLLVGQLACGVPWGFFVSRTIEVKGKFADLVLYCS
jgi:SP family general alpha glucoside:H+ symporter-like MFS transporter